MSRIKRNKKSTVSAVIVALVILGALVASLFVGEKTASKEAGSSTSEIRSFEYDKTGLAFSYGSDYSVRLVPDQGIDTIVVQSKMDASSGLQIAVLPYDDDPSTLTFQKIMADIPDMKVERPQVGTLPFGSQALSFETGDGALRTREVWFARDGHVYQMSAPIGSSGLIESTIASMEFE